MLNCDIFCTYLLFNESANLVKLKGLILDQERSATILPLFRSMTCPIIQQSDHAYAHASHFSGTPPTLPNSGWNTGELQPTCREEASWFFTLNRIVSINHTRLLHLLNHCKQQIHRTQSGVELSLCFWVPTPAWQSNLGPRKDLPPISLLLAVSF